MTLGAAPGVLQLKPRRPESLRVGCHDNRPSPAAQPQPGPVLHPHRAETEHRLPDLFQGPGCCPPGPALTT